MKINVKQVVTILVTVMIGMLIVATPTLAKRPEEGRVGFLKTVDIANSGQITDTVIDNLDFDTVNGQYPNILNVYGDIYAIAYAGVRDDGFLKTVEVTSNGQITDIVIDTLEFDTFAGLNPNIIHISGNVYALA